MTDRLTREQVEELRNVLAAGAWDGHWKEQVDALCDLALSALEGREKGLEVAAWLEEAADEIASWGAYASEYFQQKHHLDNCVALYKQRAASVVALRAPSIPTVNAQGDNSGWIAGRYRKKPVVIDAVRWDGTEKGLETVLPFIQDGKPDFSHLPCNDGHIKPGVGYIPPLGQLEIPTLEGTITASPGDWIIRGVKGEFYPCKPDIFAATYEPLPQPPTAQTSEQDGHLDGGKTERP